MLDFVRVEGSKTGENGIWCRTREAKVDAFIKQELPLVQLAPLEPVWARLGLGPQLRQSKLRGVNGNWHGLVFDHAEWMCACLILTNTNRCVTSLPPRGFEKRQHSRDNKHRVQKMGSADRCRKPERSLNWYQNCLAPRVHFRTKLFKIKTSKYVD